MSDHNPRKSQKNVLTGGNSNTVIQVENTVLRQCGVWSPFTHNLLQFLESQGFNESPRLIATDGKIETLTYISGIVGNDPMPAYLLSEKILVEAAQLLRKFHDVTQHFSVPEDAKFMLPKQKNMRQEVICHNDFAPYNLVFDNNHIIGIIDFDTAAPGERLWDIAYAAYRFVPLATDNHANLMGWANNPDREQRLRLFCDAYGLQERNNLMDMVIQRLESLVDFMKHDNLNLEHITLYNQDITYIRDNYSRLMRCVNNS